MQQNKIEFEKPDARSHLKTIKLAALLKLFEGMSSSILRIEVCGFYYMESVL